MICREISPFPTLFLQSSVSSKYNRCVYSPLQSFYTVELMG